VTIAARRLRFRHSLLAIAALALLVRVVVVLATPHFVPQTDAADYDRIAVSLAQHDRFPSSELTSHGGPTAFRAPLFPIALAAVYKLVGVGSAARRWEAGRLLEAVLGAIVVALTALLALRLWGRGAAFVSGAIAAVYPPLILVGSSLMSESLFIPLVLAAVLAALIGRVSVHRGRWSVAVGLLVGLAALTRSNGILLVVPVAFLVWPERPRLSLRAARDPLIVLVATALTLVPWTIRNEHVFHTLVPITTESGYLLAGTFNSYADHRTDYPSMWVPPVLEIERLPGHGTNLNEAQISSRLDTDALDYIDSHPAYLLKDVYWNTLRMLNLTGTGFERWDARYEAYPPGLTSLSVYAFWVVGLLALLALVTRTAALRRAPWAFWACAVALFVPNMFISGSTRYRSPVDPFIIMIAAGGLLAWRRRLGPRPPVPSAAA
jgi:4-amino-4-deoxy-L-arabinose transferase-like glycosyltransferase